MRLHERRHPKEMNALGETVVSPSLSCPLAAGVMRLSVDAAAERERGCTCGGRPRTVRHPYQQSTRPDPMLAARPRRIPFHAGCTRR